MSEYIPKHCWSYVLYVVVFLICALTSCNNEKPKQRTFVETIRSLPACNDVGRGVFVGRTDLEEQFLAGIQKINPDTAMKTDFTAMIMVRGGTFAMGGDMPVGFDDMPSTALPQGDELPKHPVRINDFWIDTHEVTNAEFRAFVEATGYITVAERPVDWDQLKKQLPHGTPKPPDEVLQPGSMVFRYAPKNASKQNLANWWAFVNGANWRHPRGPGSSIKGMDDHPVVQVCWYDAVAYAKWAGKRLPTEAEFEYAIRGGKEGNMYPWGNEKTGGSTHFANHLQGEFPYYNSKADGYEFSAPVGSFPANGYGLYDMAGNVWEWTADWYQPDYYAELAAKGIADNPCGPQYASEVYDTREKKKVIRGGSYLCHDDWCSGYRNARRMRDTPDTGMEHLGFRCVRDAAE